MRDPDIRGPYGEAWDLDLVPKPGDPPDVLGSLRGFLVRAPKRHPLWEHWIVCVVHLRPIPGQSRPAVKHYPEAEYEMLILALNPEKAPHDPDGWREKGFAWMTPPDVVEQFHGVTDSQAAKLCGLVVRHIVEQGASPDQDYRTYWAKMIHGTVAHYRDGRHQES